MNNNKFQTGFSCYLGSVEQQFIEQCSKELDNSASSKYKNRVVKAVKNQAKAYISQNKKKRRAKQHCFIF